jgi:hypothetical protein
MVLAADQIGVQGQDLPFMDGSQSAQHLVWIANLASCPKDVIADHATTSIAGRVYSDFRKRHLESFIRSDRG